MTDFEIYEKVDEFIKENLSETAFNEGLPVLQDFLWNLGGKYGITGTEVLKIYFDNASKK